MPGKQSRDIGTALRRGATGRCPNCGVGQIFQGYLTLCPACAYCGQNLHAHAPAAGPAFMTVALLGLIIGPLLWVAGTVFPPDSLALALIGIVVLNILALLLLRVVKGAMLGYLWTLGLNNLRKDEQ